ncbi:MAG: choline BCCT transporter BetT [Gammaproteobacteria bacterium]
MASPANPNSTILKPVFYPSVVVVTLLVLMAIIMPEFSAGVFTSTKDWVSNTFGWFYMLSVGIFVVFCFYLALSSLGHFKLGPDHSMPDYSYTAWFAMLFSAGMGIGLMFFGVAEPVIHYNAPPVGDGGTIQAARDAMRITFFHWGIHAWAIYALVGLVLAYFCFRHGLPLSIRSALYPLVGERIYGPIGHVVDTFAVFGTIFGVATSLGFGVTQVNAGLNYLFDVPVGIATQITLITIITAIATISVVLGLDGGIKRLSQLNLVLALMLLLFVLVAGPTLFIFQTLIQNTGNYLGNFVEMAFNVYAYDETEWLGLWTLFYWGWWIAWAPFVGMFIARISRGRTIREFILGVLLVPVGFTFIWLSVFGDTALHMIMVDGASELVDTVSVDSSVALFQFLELLPFSGITSLIAVILVVTFFVTSSDSGSLVVDTLASGGHTGSNPVWQRIFWAVLEGIVAAALLLAGGLGALQAASIASALPFTIIMLIACWGLLQALRIESVRHESLQLHMNAGRHGKVAGTWKHRLHRLIKFPDKAEVIGFIIGPVQTAMQTVKTELDQHGWNVELTADQERGIARLDIIHEGEMDFVYEVRPRYYDTPTFAFPESENPERLRKRYARAEVFLRDGGKVYDIFDYDEEVIASDIIDQFEKHRHFLHVSSSLSPALPVD